MRLLIFDVDGVLNKADRLLKGRFDAQIKAIANKYKISQKQAIKKIKKAKQTLSPKKRKTSLYAFTKLGFTKKEYFNLINSVDPKGLMSINKNCKKMLNKLKNHKIVTYSNTPRKALIKTLKIL